MMSLKIRLVVLPGIANFTGHEQDPRRSLGGRLAQLKSRSVSIKRLVGPPTRRHNHPTKGNSDHECIYGGSYNVTCNRSSQSR